MSKSPSQAEDFSALHESQPSAAETYSPTSLHTQFQCASSLSCQAGDHSHPDHHLSIENISESCPSHIKDPNNDSEDDDRIMGNRHGGDRGKGKKNEQRKDEKKKEKRRQGKDKKKSKCSADPESFTTEADEESSFGFHSFENLLAGALGGGSKSPKQRGTASETLARESVDEVVWVPMSIADEENGAMFKPDADDESTASLGYSTPLLATPMLKRSEPRTTTERLDDLGRSIEKTILDNLSDIRIPQERDSIIIFDQEKGKSHTGSMDSVDTITLEKDLNKERLNKDHYLNSVVDVDTGVTDEGLGQQTSLSTSATVKDKPTPCGKSSSLNRPTSGKHPMPPPECYHSSLPREGRVESGLTHQFSVDEDWMDEMFVSCVDVSFENDFQEEVNEESNFIRSPDKVCCKLDRQDSTMVVESGALITPSQSKLISDSVKYDTTVKGSDASKADSLEISTTNVPSVNVKAQVKPKKTESDLPYADQKESRNAEALEDRSMTSSEQGKISTSNAQVSLQVTEIQGKEIFSKQLQEVMTEKDVKEKPKPFEVSCVAEEKAATLGPNPPPDNGKQTFETRANEYNLVAIDKDEETANVSAHLTNSEEKSLQLKEENEIRNNENDVHTAQRGEGKNYVPPPSPSSMELLEEMDEDEEDIERQEKELQEQKSRDIQLFGETVFKRLSSLIETQDSINDAGAGCSVDETVIVMAGTASSKDVAEGTDAAVAEKESCSEDGYQVKVTGLSFHGPNDVFIDDSDSRITSDDKIGKDDSCGVSETCDTLPEVTDSSAVSTAKITFVLTDAIQRSIDGGDDDTLQVTESDQSLQGGLSKRTSDTKCISPTSVSPPPIKQSFAEENKTKDSDSSSVDSGTSSGSRPDEKSKCLSPDKSRQICSGPCVDSRLSHGNVVKKPSIPELLTFSEDSDVMAASNREDRHEKGKKRESQQIHEVIDAYCIVDDEGDRDSLVLTNPSVVQENVTKSKRLRSKKMCANVADSDSSSDDMQFCSLVFENSAYQENDSSALSRSAREENSSGLVFKNSDLTGKNSKEKVSYSMNVGIPSLIFGNSSLQHELRARRPSPSDSSDDSSSDGSADSQENRGRLSKRQSSSSADSALRIPEIEETFSELMNVKSFLEELQDRTPTSERLPVFVGPELMKSPELLAGGRRSRMSPAVTDRTESDLDISEQRDDISTDSMLADDEDEGGELLFSKSYSEEQGSEVLVSCTIYNTAHEEDSDDFWAESSAAEETFHEIETSANAATSAFQNARKQMHDIHEHLQDLRRQMEFLQDDVQNATLKTKEHGVDSSDVRLVTE